MAREEVWARAPSPSKHSLSGSRSSIPVSLSGTDVLVDREFEEPPLGARSILERRKVTSPELEVLRHSSHISRLEKELPVSPTHSISVPNQPAGSDQGATPEPTVPELRRLDTPPASETGGSFSSDLKSTSDQSNALQHTGLPTPEPSPDMGPVSDSSLGDHPETIEELNNSNASEATKEGLTANTSPVTQSPSSQHPTESDVSTSSQSTVLKEPTLDDFLHLSDDDIAEEQAEGEEELESPSQSLPPTPMSLAPRPRVPSPPMFSSSPFHSRPATAAAFEVARIAARHNFDLIYVVNLWPDECNERDPQATPTKQLYVPSKTDQTKGRFLAAYGLSTVKSPFQISTMVHRRILQTDGWIEYRNDEAEPDDFARGYACAFYRGQYPGHQIPNSVDRTEAPFKTREANIDRGIVFAAYRKPSDSHDKSAVNCSQAQLCAIYRDAEALVEMLIDTHMTNRLRNPPTDALYSLYSDETGPLPTPSYMGRV